MKIAMWMVIKIRGSSICLHLRGSVTGTQDCCELESRFLHLDALQDKTSFYVISTRKMYYEQNVVDLQEVLFWNEKKAKKRVIKNDTDFLQQQSNRVLRVSYFKKNDV